MLLEDSGSESLKLKNNLRIMQGSNYKDLELLCNRVRDVTSRNFFMECQRLLCETFLSVTAFSIFSNSSSPTVRGGARDFPTGD